MVPVIGSQSGGFEIALDGGTFTILGWFESLNE
jgi:hypothetical protein